MRNYLSKPQIIIRLIPGMTFFLEGIQKLLYTDILGIGRFQHIGIPYAEFWAPFVAWVEILFGVLLIIGLYTRLATIPLLIVMLVAFLYTKWPVFANEGFLPMFHEYRTDYSMTLTLVYLLLTGAGYYSLDRVLGMEKKRILI